MDKNQIIEFLGSEEIYEKYRKLVIDELKKQIELLGLTTHFEGTNVYEQFADFYIQGWLYSNQRAVDKICELKNKNFSQEEIKEYINKNPIIPDDIQRIISEEFMYIFDDKDISTEKKQKKEDYFKNPELLSEEEALNLMKKDNQEEVFKTMEFFNLQSFKDELNLQKRHFLNINSDPKNVGFGRKGIKSVIRENTGSKPSMRELPENEEYDYDVNSDQIFIIGFPKGYPYVYAYIPNKEYPKGTLRSTLIQNEIDSKCTDELESLYKKYQGKVDFGGIYRQVMERVNINGMGKE